LNEYKKYNTFACGTSLTPAAVERFDPYGRNSLYEGLTTEDGYAHTICDPVSSGMATCYRSETFDLNLDLAHANLGILGNTQDGNLTDAQKVNEYLAWYLTGTPQIGDQLPVNPDSSSQIDRVVNYSGPLRKLLPYDLTTLARTTLANTTGEDVHNYYIENKDFPLGAGDTRLNSYDTFWQSFWDGFSNASHVPVNWISDALLAKIIQNVPFSSMEDIAGEVTLSVFRDKSADQQSENVESSYSANGKSTAPLQLIIKKADKAVSP
jgi:hypothetical protein